MSHQSCRTDFHVSCLCGIAAPAPYYTGNVQLPVLACTTSTSAMVQIPTHEQPYIPNPHVGSNTTTTSALAVSLAESCAQSHRQSALNSGAADSLSLPRRRRLDY